MINVPAHRDGVRLPLKNSNMIIVLGTAPDPVTGNAVGNPLVPILGPTEIAQEVDRIVRLLEVQTKNMTGIEARDDAAAAGQQTVTRKDHAATTKRMEKGDNEEEDSDMCAGIRFPRKPDFLLLRSHHRFSNNMLYALNKKNNHS